LIQEDNLGLSGSSREDNWRTGSGARRCKELLMLSSIGADPYDEYSFFLSGESSEPVSLGFMSGGSSEVVNRNWW